MAKNIITEPLVLRRLSRSMYRLSTVREDLGNTMREADDPLEECPDIVELYSTYSQITDALISLMSDFRSLDTSTEPDEILEMLRGVSGKPQVL